MPKTRSYRELILLPSFEDRFDYLSLTGEVGVQTFGFDRFINQQFYHSREWKDVRQYVIARDLGCDLGVEGHEITDRLLIHHINPLTIEHFSAGAELALDPENLITTCHRTHNAIHFGDASLLPKPMVDRKPGDTNLWPKLR